MRIIEFFAQPSTEQEKWLAAIGSGDWAAARFLKEHIADGTLRSRWCPNVRVLLAVEGDTLQGFCTLSDMDDVQPTPLTPWIGFVYAFPAYRGKRLSGKLIERACTLARTEGHRRVYLSTNETGLYEKYGFEFFEAAKDLWGGDTRVYARRLN